jgi:hypothetical protein
MMKEYRERGLLISPDMLLDKMLAYSQVRLHDPVYTSLAYKKSLNLKHINIVDPTFQKNNLGKSISKLNASRIKYGITLHERRLSSLYDQALKAEMKAGNGAELLLKGLLKMFQITFECTGASPVIALLLPQVVQRGLETQSLFGDDFDVEYESVSAQNDQMATSYSEHHHQVHS